MKIDKLKRDARTGDALVTVSSKWVRFFTMESFSHAAIILVENGIVYVVEVQETIGTTRKLLFDDWIKNYELSFLCKPPSIVALNRNIIHKSILEYLSKPLKKRKYGYWTLPLVWLNQVFPHLEFHHTLNVCSTLVGHFWRSSGWTNGRKLMDPGDIVKESLTIYRIER